MQPTDIRIGNKVKYDGRIVEVVGIDPPIPFAKNKNSYRFVWLYEPIDTFREVIKNIKGILLTPEILVKCGFKGETSVNDSIIGSYHLDKIGIGTKEPGHRNGFYYFSSFVHCPIVDIKYLHQLQNLFYILCGKELEVNI